MDIISDHKDASRLARTIMSDIALYNREAIQQGIKNDSLFEDMKGQLEEGRRLYDSRVGQDMPNRWVPYNRNSGRTRQAVRKHRLGHLVNPPHGAFGTYRPA